TGGVTTSNDSVNWVTNGAGELKIVLREGMAVAEAPGLVPAGTNLFATGEKAFNSNGTLLAYNAELAAGPGVNSGNKRLVVIGSADQQMMAVAREGFTAPGTGGATWGNSFGEARLADNGTIALQNQLTGAGVTAANDMALFVGQPDDLQLVIREGDQAPGFAP